MPGFEPGDVVRVPFPCTDGEATQHRPALVLARTGPGRDGDLLLWVLMITSAENRGWAGDVAIPDHEAAGLPAPSVIRCAKIATIDAARADMRGRVDSETLATVAKEVSRSLEPARR